MDEQSNSYQTLRINTDDAEDILDRSYFEKVDLARLFIRIQDPTMIGNSLVDNRDNNIPGIHPEEIIVPVAENVIGSGRIEMNFDVIQYLKKEQESTFNSLGRFPCPVILFNGKYICRSRYPPISKNRQNEQNSEVSSSSEPERYEFVQKDVDFLNGIDVKRIVDLSKGFRSSKILRNVYEPFEISCMPYPALHEFDAALKPIVDMTQNIVLNCLVQLIKGNGGILIQTFNGHFRASLFTSLLRLSLWADGLIHRNLAMPEVAFLSIGYDWYLFGGHTGADPEVTRKMMMLFFSFLTVISTDAFSLTRMIEYGNKDATGFPRFQASRRDHLRIMGIHLLKCYSDTAKYIALKKASG